MSSVRSGPFDQKNITYIVTGASLVNDLVTYTQSLSAALVQVGTFAAHANAALVTQGYLLVDTGKRLVPGQQPNVPTLLIGVNAIPMDTSGRRLGSFAGTTATAITGFIDPNSPNVAVYSRDRPTTFNDNLYFSGATNLQAAGDKMTNASLLGSSGATDFTAAGNGAGVRHRGPGVFSGGTLTAAGGSVISTAAVAGGALTATVTAASAANGVVTYTATNTFAAGEVVSITGLSTAAFNLTNVVIATASASLFTVSNPATGTAVTGASGVATVSESSVIVPTGLTGNTASGAVLTTATFTSASYTTATGVLLFTVPNTFTAGQTVTISGVTVTAGSAAVFNLTNALIASATSSSFTINTAISQGTNTANNNTGTATVTVPALTVTSGGLRVNAGSTLTVTLANTAVGYDNASGILTYTVGNSFIPGQMVSISGFGGTDAGVVNIRGVIATSSLTIFTINSTPGLSSSLTITGTGTVVATQNSLTVTSANTTVNNSLVVAGGVNVFSTTPTAITTTFNNYSPSQSIYTFANTATSPSITISSTFPAVGAVFYIAVSQTGNALSSIAITGGGTYFISSGVAAVGASVLCTVIRTA